MVNIETSWLLFASEEEPLENPVIENDPSPSLGCFECPCSGQKEDRSEKWWVQGGLSRNIKRGREFSKSVIEEAGNYCCGSQKWKNVVHRLRSRNNGRSIKRGQQFQYDMPSYALNFDDGSRSPDYV